MTDNPDSTDELDDADEFDEPRAPGEGAELEESTEPFALDDAPSANIEDESADVTSLAMFEGDMSTLYEDQRRCLHAILKHRYISAWRHPEHWATLQTSRGIIESRLNELFLELQVEPGFQIAFKRQAVADNGDPLPSLLREVAHTKEETIVMVSLRQKFFAQRQEGDDIVFVDRQALLDEIADERPEHSTHRAMDNKRAQKAIDALASAGVLLKTQDPERFRISPIIEVLMPITKLRALWTWLMTHNGTKADLSGVELELDQADAEQDEPGDLLLTAQAVQEGTR